MQNSTERNTSIHPPLPSKLFTTNKKSVRLVQAFDSSLLAPQLAYVNQYAGIRCGWRALFGSERDSQDGFKGLLGIAYVAIRPLRVDEEFIRDAIGDCLTKFGNLTEQEAFDLEASKGHLRNIGNFVKSRAVDELRRLSTVKGTAELHMKSLDTPTERPMGDGDDIAPDYNPAIATSDCPLESAFEITQSILGCLLANRQRLIAEANDDCWRCAVAILGSQSCQQAFETGTERDLDLSVTQSVARTFSCSERTARDKKREVYERIDTACQQGSCLWTKIREGLRTEAGSNVVDVTHHIVVGRAGKQTTRPIRTRVVISGKSQIKQNGTDHVSNLLEVADANVLDA